MHTEACLACFEGRLATLLETATRLHFVRVDETGATVSHVLHFAPTTPAALAGMLHQGGTRLLLCGGVCRRWLYTLKTEGIDVVPWLTGTETEVLAALARGDLETLVMPGCMRRLGTTGGGVCVRARHRTRRE